MSDEELVQEAADTSTDPERLRQLAEHGNWFVRQAAWRNPSVPEDVWRDGLCYVSTAAWCNPMATIYFFAWTPRQNDRSALEIVMLAMEALQKEPERCSPEGKALINTKLQEWWSTSVSPFSMMSYLGEWANTKGNASPEHKEAVRILILCVRTATNLTDKDRQALDFVEAWSAGGKDRRNEAFSLASVTSVKSTIKFAWDPSHVPWYTIDSLLNVVPSPKETERHLADVIRQAMPLPPVLE